MRRCAATLSPTATASLRTLPGAQDRDRRRHHQRNAVAAGEGAEVRQHQGEVAQILRRGAALVRGVLLRGDRGPQLLGRLVVDIAQYRHDQATRRIDGDREIDVLEQNARIARRIVPGVQGRLGAPGADHRAYQPQHVVAALRPAVDVGIVAHGAQAGFARATASCCAPWRAARRAAARQWRRRERSGRAGRHPAAPAIAARPAPARRPSARAPERRPI